VSERLIWQVGNRNPSITENIVDSAGAAVDLTGATVQFRMRAVGSSTLKVDASATIVGAPTGGNVRYDWAALDVDTAGEYLIWWVVTSGGKTQDVMEALIEFRAHAPLALSYIELEEFKETTNLKGKTYADGDIQSAIIAASRGIDKAMGRRFYADADASQVRYYPIRRICTIAIDDLITLTEFAVDADGDGTFEAVWTLNTDFTLEPLNSVADGRPWETIRRNPRTGQAPWPIYYPRAARVTGKFGWAAVPEAIKTLTTLIAERLVKRTREAPFGLIGFGQDGATVRAAAYANDPEFKFLTDAYRRGHVLA